MKAELRHAQGNRLSVTRVTYKGSRFEDVVFPIKFGTGQLRSDREPAGV